MSIKPIIILKTTIKRNLLVEIRILPCKSRVLSITLIMPRKWKGSSLRKNDKSRGNIKNRIHVTIARTTGKVYENRKSSNWTTWATSIFMCSSCKNAGWWNNHFNTVWKAPPYTRIESTSLRFMNHYLHCLFYAWILSEE